MILREEAGEGSPQYKAEHEDMKNLWFPMGEGPNSLCLWGKTPQGKHRIGAWNACRAQWLHTCAKPREHHMRQVGM